MISISQALAKYSSFIILVLASWGLKALLIPAYFSTDFAVHQNWLRITHEKPLSQWYYDAESKWTLDYPPFFAHFEYLLSVIANFINPSIISTLNSLPETILFQRLSVIFTDLFYFWSILKFSQYKINLRLVILYLWIPFILLDNIHFQYNLILQSILVFSIGFMRQKRYILSAILFSSLLNFKHIYLYCSPAFFFYLIKEYVANNTLKVQSRLSRGLKLFIATIAPFIISFGPFFVVGGVPGIRQILSRMFPFSRGLIHHYWAPNFWALYYFLDKILKAVNFRAGVIYELPHEGSTVNILRVLPSISPGTTVAIILALLFPIILAYMISRRKVNFVQLASVCGLVFFMFGFHVHEKAIVPYLNILFLFCKSTPYLNTAVFVNIVNLIPLIIEPKEKSLCLIICLIWVSVWQVLDRKKRQQLVAIQHKILFQFDLNLLKDAFFPNILELLIEITGILIVIFQLFIHPLINKPSLQFLPLMMNSVWAALFNLGWIGYLYCKFIKEYAFKKTTAIENSQQKSQQE